MVYVSYFPYNFLLIVSVSVRGRKCGKHDFWVNSMNLLPHMVSASELFSPLTLSFMIKPASVMHLQLKYVAKYTAQTVSVYDLPPKQIFHH